MIDIKYYFNQSPVVCTISDIFIDSEGFAENYKLANEIERKSILQHFIHNNKPFAFNDKPLLYENIVQYIASRLDLSSQEIRLIGSAKTGFSISKDHYGVTYSKTGRDLDFTIINDELFQKLKGEFEEWGRSFEAKKISARNNTETTYWIANLQNVPKGIERGFIDSYKIPNLTQFEYTRKVNNCLFLIGRMLKSNYELDAKKISARIYRSWPEFNRQLKYNMDFVMKD